MEAPNRPGRPPAFDRAAVLDAAVDQFWRHGYEATSTRDLEAALGISQSSIYNAFGSKRDLYDVALDRYEERVRAELVSLLTSGKPDAVTDFLVALRGWVTADGQRGCLMVNLMSSQPAEAASCARSEAFRSDLRSALEIACRAEPRVHDAEIRADLLLAASLGVCVAARAGASDAELERMIAAARLA